MSIEVDSHWEPLTPGTVSFFSSEMRRTEALVSSPVTREIGIELINAEQHEVTLNAPDALGLADPLQVLRWPYQGAQKADCLFMHSRLSELYDRRGFVIVVEEPDHFDVEGIALSLTHISSPLPQTLDTYPPRAIV